MHSLTPNPLEDLSPLLVQKPANRFRNRLLQSLDAASVERLALRPVKLELRHEIEFPGSTIDHIYFIEEGVGSMTTTFKDGSQVEVGLFGYEAAMGVSGLMGTRHSLNRVYMQIAGYGFASPMEAATREFRRFDKFHDLALRYVQAQLTQATQSAGCNAKHELEQRLARWLLLCSDRARSENFSISHEFLADMLGVSRPTISVAAAQMKEQGLISYTRGIIHIIDPPGLEKKSCECYRVVKDHLDNYLDFDTGFVV